MLLSNFSIDFSVFNLFLLALALLYFLFLDFEDFAVDIIGKEAENFFTTLSIPSPFILSHSIHSFSSQFL